MSEKKPWHQKLSAHGRMLLEEGLPKNGVDLSVRITPKDKGAVEQLESSGLALHVHIDEIVVGRVANIADLERIAELPCVVEVELARSLYAEPTNTFREET